MKLRRTPTNEEIEVELLECIEQMSELREREIDARQRYHTACANGAKNPEKWQLKVTVHDAEQRIRDVRNKMVSLRAILYSRSGGFPKQTYD